jgi:hypothetical protein
VPGPGSRGALAGEGKGDAAVVMIPRSTASTRAGSSTASRSGELHGAAPVPHQVREIVVKVEQLPDGRWRLTQPRVAGWGAAARTPGEVVAALRRGFTEAQVAAYSDWRGHVYDAEMPVHRRTRPAARTRRRCDVYHPTEWRLAEDGVWVSPRGHRYPESRQAVQNVMAARRSMGLPARPDPVPRTAAVRMVAQVTTARKVADGQDSPIRLGQLVIQRQRAL